jgi:phosphohistidine phosphatase
MNVYLVRHADALPLGEQGVTTDEGRPLSEPGLRQARQLGQILKRRGVTPAKILTSPLRRAVQTAEELAQALETPGLQVAPCDELAPGRSPKKLVKNLRRLGPGDVLLVGHEPDISRHTARLIGGKKKTRLEFAKGGIACVACDSMPRKKGGVLRWLLTPDWLAAGSA